MPNNIHFKVEIFLSSFIKKNFQNILFLETAALRKRYCIYNGVSKIVFSETAALRHYNKIVFLQRTMPVVIWFSQWACARCNRPRCNRSTTFYDGQSTL